MESRSIEQERGRLLINIEAWRHMANAAHKAGILGVAHVCAQGFLTARSEYRRFERNANSGNVYVDFGYGFS